MFSYMREIAMNLDTEATEPCTRLIGQQILALDRYATASHVHKGCIYFLDKHLYFSPQHLS